MRSNTFQCLAVLALGRKPLLATKKLEDVLFMHQYILDNTAYIFAALKFRLRELLTCVTSVHSTQLSVFMLHKVGQAVEIKVLH
jgi:hypothetical protein